MEHYLDIAEDLYFNEGKTIKQAINMMLKIKEMEGKHEK